MNRDEKRSRVAALLPGLFSYPGRRAIYPHEPGGGTWLSVNDTGLCLALINWHTINRQPNDKPASRGQIIPGLAGAATLRTIAHRLGTTRLHNLRPFRLLAFAPGEEAMMELRWDLEELAAQRHPWRVRHWFSSGRDEPEAARQRGRTCAEWSASLGRAAALRRLHASHLPQRGPFSICMHRNDAATVSYVEVNVGERRVALKYSPGPPCENYPATTKWLPRQRR